MGNSQSLEISQNGRQALGAHMRGQLLVPKRTKNNKKEKGIDP